MDWMWGKENRGVRDDSMFLAHRRMDAWCMDNEWIDSWKDGTLSPMGNTEREPDLAGSSGIGVMLTAVEKANELNLGTQ